MIGLNIPMPTSCEDCPLCTQDGDCIAMGGDSLFDFLPPDAQYFPNGWKCGRCPLIDLTQYEDDLK